MNFAVSEIDFSTDANALRDLWMSLPKATGNYCPKKTDFSPVALRQHLKSIFMYERESEDVMRIRVAGTRIRDYLGMETTGANQLELAPPELRPQFKEFYDNLSRFPCIGIFERISVRKEGTEERIKTIHFPLLDNDGSATVFVGAFLSEHVPLEIDFLTGEIKNSAKEAKLTYINIGAGTPADEALQPKTA